MTRELLNWTQKKFYEIDEETKHPNLKAFGIGVVEGFIDGAIISFPILLIGCGIKNNKIKKLTK